MSHHFHVDKNEDESGIYCDMVFGRELMVQLGIWPTLSAKSFNGMVIQYP